MILSFALLSCLWTGCTAEPVAVSEATTSASISTKTAKKFDADAAATLRGQVRWQGDAPQVPPFDVMASIMYYPHWHIIKEKGIFDNPNVPQIDPSWGGVAGAVVFLRGVDPEQARPWDHAPVKVAFEGYRIDVLQGEQRQQTGFVQTGATAEFVSHEQRFHLIRCNGANYFSLTLPQPHKPRHRRLNHKGLVELTSGAGYYWMRGYLFVDDHPYYTRTDQRGYFTLEQVPPGEYELVAWLPNWHEAERDRDPGYNTISRLSYQPPVEQVYRIYVQTGQNEEVNFTFSEKLFASPPHAAPPE